MLLQSFIAPVIKISDSCNYRCCFCHYSKEASSENLMTADLCKTIIREVHNYNVMSRNETIRVIFHGGEPLLQPISFFEEVLAYEEHLAESSGVSFANSIQTNGFLINEHWLELFEHYGFDIGISLDGPGDLNYHFGSLGREESTRRVLSNIDLINRRGIPFGVISVITNAHLDRAADLYSFCIEHNITDLSLNFCFDPLFRDCVDVEKLGRFLSDLFDLYSQGSFPLNIREFNECIAKACGYVSDTCATRNRENCGQYLTFSHQGDVYFCDTCHDSSSVLGNISESSLYDIIDSTQYISKLLEARKPFEHTCKKCHIAHICGSGCHRYDVSPDKNYYCEALRSMCEVILKYTQLNKIKQ